MRNEELWFDRVSVLQEEKSSVDGWWQWQHNSVDVLETTELCTKNG